MYVLSNLQVIREKHNKLRPQTIDVKERQENHKFTVISKNWKLFIVRCNKKAEKYVCMHFNCDSYWILLYIYSIAQSFFSFSLSTSTQLNWIYIVIFRCYAVHNIFYCIFKVKVISFLLTISSMVYFFILWQYPLCVCVCFYPFESLVIIGAKFSIETHKTYLLKRKLDSFSIHWLLIFLIEIMKTALIEIYKNYYLFTAVYSWANYINKKKEKNEYRKVSFNKTWFLHHTNK